MFEIDWYFAPEEKQGVHLDHVLHAVHRVPLGSDAVLVKNHFGLGLFGLCKEHRTGKSSGREQERAKAVHAWRMYADGGVRPIERSRAGELGSVCLISNVPN